MLACELMSHFAAIKSVATSEKSIIHVLIWRLLISTMSLASILDSEIAFDRSVTTRPAFLVKIRFARDGGLNVYLLQLSLDFY